MAIVCAINVTSQLNANPGEGVLDAQGYGVLESEPLSTYPRNAD